jgi:hypothetical protein
MENQTFDLWFDLLIDCLKRLGYKGPIDKESFQEDYDEGKTPEEVALTFSDDIS